MMRAKGHLTGISNFRFPIELILAFKSQSLSNRKLEIGNRKSQFGSRKYVRALVTAWSKKDCSPVPRRW